jgi:hypothetical protein
MSSRAALPFLLIPLLASPSPARTTDRGGADQASGAPAVTEQAPIALIDPLPETIGREEAVARALDLLEAHGVEHAAVCETHRIEAPLTGYLVDALGRMTLGDSVLTSFRIGVRDGLEQRDGMFMAGEEFVFIARGVDSEGSAIWFPAPGPDQPPILTDDSDLPYEFLLYRAEFETLGDRFPAAPLEDGDTP